MSIRDHDFLVILWSIKDRIQIVITWQCVVDAGRPVIDAIMTRIDAVRTTENPIEGVISHILVPIVSITFLPYNTNPKQIPIAPQTRII